ncbi:hypothetical protein Droror1_Dr00024594 [Drosera rotundifolia]
MLLTLCSLGTIVGGHDKGKKVGTSRSEHACMSTHTSTIAPALALPLSLSTFTFREATERFRAIFAWECIIEKVVDTSYFEEWIDNRVPWDEATINELYELPDPEYPPMDYDHANLVISRNPDAITNRLCGWLSHIRMFDASTMMLSIHFDVSFLTTKARIIQYLVIKNILPSGNRSEATTINVHLLLMLLRKEKMNFGRVLFSSLLEYVRCFKSNHTLLSVEHPASSWVYASRMGKRPTTRTSASRVSNSITIGLT